jgi:prepilin signal peptidase PulO-like enzyme (type II secretory pathway)
MTFIFAIIFFVLGLIIGSFLNVVILRTNTGRSLDGRSGCMSCMHKLSWYELIPVFSFLGLRGRCRNCKSKISIQYPLVEFSTGIIFVFLFWKFQDIFFLNSFVFLFSYVFYAFAFSLLIVIATYDLRHKIIPDSFVLILGIWSFIGLFFFSAGIFYAHVPTLLEFCSGPLVAAPFALLWLVSSGRWMGLGDAKLVIGLGWLLGLTQALSGVVLAFWVGAVIGLLVVVFSRKHGMKSELPFAPFLVLGALLVFLFELRLF